MSAVCLTFFALSASTAFWIFSSGFADLGMNVSLKADSSILTGPGFFFMYFYHFRSKKRKSGINIGGFYGIFPVLGISGAAGFSGFLAMGFSGRFSDEGTGRPGTAS
jgi:hypothetical protein